MELPAAGPGAGALDVGDDLGRGGEGGFFCQGGAGGGGGGGDRDVAVGFGEEGVDVGGLLRDGGEGAALEGPFGAGV